jgi:mannose-1-phosphate guanylyltransferase/phosphomannomutase
MKAILFADRDGTELQPLTDKSCVALLPIAAKPLIDYTLDALCDSQIHDVIVVISELANEIERHLGDGKRWGLQFDYVRYHEQEEPASVLARSQLTDSEYLLIRGDVLRSLNLKDFLAKADAFETGQVVATIDGSNAGVCFIRQQSGQNQLENLPDFYSVNDQNESVHTVAMTGKFSQLESLEAYHQANLQVAAGKFPNLVILAYSVTEQLQVGYRSKVSDKNAGLVGAFCRVDNKAALLGDVVLSDDVIVDRHAQLNATVVLPSTYIGEAVTLENAIVWGRTLIQVDTGEIKEVEGLLDFNKDCVFFG